VRPKTLPTAHRAGLPPVFSYTAARAAGISAERLYSYRDQGLIQQIGRGLYQWVGASEADQNLLEIAHRAPRGTLCLVTALARHGLTDAIPDRIDVAIPRGNRAPSLQSPVNIHVFAVKTFDLGRETIDIGAGVSVGLYSAERSLVDAIRLRHREGSETAWEALRRWLRRRGSKPAALVQMAKHFHGAERAVRNALEVVL
jgi:predicted transcriptional regulator of viral defense system